MQLELKAQKKTALIQPATEKKYPSTEKDEKGRSDDDDGFNCCRNMGTPSNVKPLSDVPRSSSRLIVKSPFWKSNSCTGHSTVVDDVHVTVLQSFNETCAEGVESGTPKFNPTTDTDGPPECGVFRVADVTTGAGTKTALGPSPFANAQSYIRPLIEAQGLVLRPIAINPRSQMQNACCAT